MLVLGHVGYENRRPRSLPRISPRLRLACGITPYPFLRLPSLMGSYKPKESPPTILRHEPTDWCLTSPCLHRHLGSERDPLLVVGSCRIFTSEGLGNIGCASSLATSWPRLMAYGIRSLGPSVHGFRGASQKTIFDISQFVKILGHLHLPP